MHRFVIQRREFRVDFVLLVRVEFLASVVEVSACDHAIHCKQRDGYQQSTAQ